MADESKKETAQEKADREEKLEQDRIEGALAIITPHYSGPAEILRRAASQRAELLAEKRASVHPVRVTAAKEETPEEETTSKAKTSKPSQR